MNIEDLREYCLSLDGVTEKTPFGKFARRYESVLVFYVVGHMFCFADMDDFTSVTVRFTPEEADEIRECHTSADNPMNRSLKYWVRLNFNGDISDSLVYSLVRRSYDIVKTKYKKNADMKISRCPWCGDDPLYVKYHDEEWGRPVTDDTALFEFLVLESAQAGLSWLTVLRKREGYRESFHGFDYRRVAQMTLEDEERLRHFDGIVKNRLKIHSAVVNARLFSSIVDEFGSFYNYVIGFLPDGKRIINDVPSMEAVAVSSSISDAMSKDMRRRGFKFFGTTICYAFLQATGFIDDHLNSCRCKIKR